MEEIKNHWNTEYPEIDFAENKKEIELYKKYKDYFSYGVYIAKKV